jgi:hypothetical protein
MGHWMTVAALAALLLFCVFGLPANYEPSPAATQWTWRALSLLVGTAWGAVTVCLLGHRRPRQA